MKLSSITLFVCLLMSPLLSVAASPRTVTVTMGDYAFKPDTIRVQAGETVKLQFINTDSLTPHNFTLKHEKAGLNVNLDVSAGESATVTITPKAPGRYTFYCDKQLLFFESHREHGMVGTLIVVPSSAPTK